MKSQTTLFVTVGRADPRPILTCSSESPHSDAMLSAAEIQERVSLVNGGVSTERIQFHREESDIAEPVTVKPRKGKG